MVAPWLESLSTASVLLGLVCAAYLVIAVIRHPEKMWIMNLVWPITALYFGPFAIWAYYAMGGRMSKPFWQSVVVGGTHCGAGCTLGDIIAEFALFVLIGCGDHGLGADGNNVCRRFYAGVHPGNRLPILRDCADARRLGPQAVSLPPCRPTRSR